MRQPLVNSLYYMQRAYRGRTADEYSASNPPGIIRGDDSSGESGTRSTNTEWRPGCSERLRGALATEDFLSGFPLVNCCVRRGSCILRVVFFFYFPCPVRRRFVRCPRCICDNFSFFFFTLKTQPECCPRRRLGGAICFVADYLVFRVR